MGKRQDMEIIEAEIQKKIEDAKRQFQLEYEGKKSESNRSQDETSRNVKKLETKVTHLAKSVYEIFKQFDEFSGAASQKDQ